MKKKGTARGSKKTPKKRVKKVTSRKKTIPKTRKATQKKVAKKTTAKKATKKTAKKNSGTAAPQKAASKAKSTIRKAPPGKAASRAVKPASPKPLAIPATEPVTPAIPPIGVVTHYYSHLSVAVVQLTEGPLRVGDMIHIKGHTTDLKMPVESMEIDHQSTEEVARGQIFGLKVRDHVREHDQIYRAQSA